MLIIVVFRVLRELSSLMLPLVLASLLTVINLPLVSFLEKRRIPRFLITLVVSLTTLGALLVIIQLIRGTVEQLIIEKDVLAQQFYAKLTTAMTWVGSIVPGINTDQLWAEINDFVSPSNIASLIGTAFGALSSFGSSSVFFIIYYLILLSGATGYNDFVEYVAGPAGTGRTREIWDKTQESIVAYISIKTVMSLITGLLAGLICMAFGLQFAMFWGFLAFILNYIPSIGSIIATGTPLVMAIIQFDSFGLIIALGILLAASQFVIGNVIDPMVMGNRLRLNTVTVIFGLFFWGYIWGITGMLLSVPMMVMLRLLLERSEDFSVVARVMGNPGKRNSGKLQLRPIFARFFGGRSDEEAEAPSSELT